MNYYIKKLGHQELGSVKKDGSASRGRYVYISKSEVVTSFFPPLSRSVKNDSSLLPIIPLYNDLRKTKKVYCNYIYHNDKFFSGTRNEYRIYLNNSLENSTYLFEVDDILVFSKCELANNEDEENQTVYFLEFVRDRESLLYRKLNNVLLNSNIRGNHASYNEYLDEIEVKKKEVLKNISTVKISIDDSVSKTISKGTKTIESLFTNSSFRDFVLTGYEELCAVTRTVIRHDAFMNLEAAHIKPRSHGGTYKPSNGLALCRDVHWAFDKGFFTLNDEYEVIVHKEVRSEYLLEYEGRKIYLPSDDFFKPDIESIKYHRDNVFGLFLTSGRL